LFALKATNGASCFPEWTVTVAPPSDQDQSGCRSRGEFFSCPRAAA